MINEILDIEEDLSNYQEPEVIYGVGKEESTGVNLFDGDIDTLFADTIKFRGKDYFDNKMIHHCELSNSKYIAYVQGTDFSTESKVAVAIFIFFMPVFAQRLKSSGLIPVPPCKTRGARTFFAHSSKISKRSFGVDL